MHAQGMRGMARKIEGNEGFGLDNPRDFAERKGVKTKESYRGVRSDEGNRQSRLY